MEIFTEKRVSPVGQVNKADLFKWGQNLVVFSGPAMAAFFGLLAQGVPFNKAWPVALLILYQAVADLFKKFTNPK